MHQYWIIVQSAKPKTRKSKTELTKRARQRREKERSYTCGANWEKLPTNPLTNRGVCRAKQSCRERKITVCLLQIGEEEEDEEESFGSFSLPTLPTNNEWDYKYVMIERNFGISEFPFIFLSKFWIWNFWIAPQDLDRRNWGGARFRLTVWNSLIS